MSHPRPRASRRARRLIATGALALLAAAATPALATTGPAAELVTNNLFLGTTKVEAGARANGSFGSTVAAPAGYNPRTESGTILGFRVNPNECAWTAPSCVTQGDFFTPGSPYESWGIQVGDGTTPAYNSNSANGIPGAFASADAASVSGVWRSTAPFGGIAVKQTYAIPAYAWMIDTTVELTNTTGAAINDVYFMRGLDPDNCRMETLAVCDSDGDGVADTTGVYETNNTVVSQGSASSNALVTATQTDDTYLGLRMISGQGRAFAQNSGFSNPASLSTLWSGGNGSYRATLGSTFGDAGIYAVDHVSSIAAGATATVRVQYVVKEIAAAADISDTVTSAGGLVDVPAGNGGNAFQGTCTAPAHGTVTAEGGKMRYVPNAGFTGTDTFQYSTGGPCGTATIIVTAAAAPLAATPPALPAVTLLATAKRTTTASGNPRVVQRLQLNRKGRYTFIYGDPATGKRVRQISGTRVGKRLLGRKFSAPVLVTSIEGTKVVLSSVFQKNLSAKVRRTMTLRIVLRSPDGTLTDVAPR